ncbi:Taurine-binding protein periplasmic protein TauA [Rubellimicrobium mesophilum DSM 19309]|uniref:Taurine-binding protein periplasmic protein TauA n=1 Tax=Rubellimicrobium mesophilum DSM 19309 TaxID=442562 RepID=A0A017HPV8_9RHOB|nr:ABC transporter substrate-binding protein [Rubellimicrobium mesophilum]EYD76355.1 Taurine-binding protein periplasmic protein TauA [Rubellimicrobium mesophilum DSM 19309]
MTKGSKLAGLLLGAALLAGPALAQEDGITVAYFLEWPMPFEFAKVQGLYEEALGVPVEWVSFDTGTAMSAAMAAGDVDIAVSQGVPPFVVATSAGQDLQLLGIAVSYSENDNCVVRSDLEIDKDNAGEALPGKKVAVPLGTAAHYGFLRQMEHFGVPLDSLEVVDMAPPEGAAALEQGSVDMFCGYGAAVTRAKEAGNVLLTGAEKEELGILVFDVISAPAAFVDENPDLVAKFLQVTGEMNDRWNAGGAGADEMLPVIAQDAGMDEQATRDFMATFSFPSNADQLGEKWLGGGVQEFMKGVAQVFVDAGSIPSALDSYDGVVDAEPLKAAGAM